MPVQCKLRVLEWNAQGIRHKTIELLDLLKRKNIDILLVNETFLVPTIKLFLDGYTIYRKDRTSHGGGVAIAIKSALSHEPLPHINTSIIENVSILLHHNNKKIVFSSVYNPKDSPFFKADMLKLIPKNAEYFIFGDLNARHRFWNCLGYNRSGTALHRLLLRSDFVVHFPDNHTHHPHRGNPSTIDILLSNSTRTISKPEALIELGSDHIPVFCSIELNVTLKNPNLVPNYGKADWIRYQVHINNNLDLLSPLEDRHSIDKCIEDLTNCILNAKQLAVPMQLKHTNSLQISDNTKTLISLRNQVRRHWQRYRTPALKTHLNRLNVRIKNKIQAEKNSHWSNTLSKFQTGSKQLWKITKSLRGKTSCGPSVIISNNRTLLNTSEKVNAIADSFERSHTLTSDFTHPNDAVVMQNVQQLNSNTDINTDATTLTTPTLVHSLLRTLRPLKAPGPDKIHNILLKKLPKRGVVQLTRVFNACIQLGHFPKCWKTAKIIPIPKPGKNPTDPSSYRPISLLNAIGKVFEKIISYRMTSFIQDNNILPPEQFGFVFEHSCPRQLKRVLNAVNREKANKKTTAMILLDIEKAFDSVWHNGLIFKLKTLGFPLYLIRLIQSFLADRNFNVSLLGSNSTTRNIPAGVPQGSVLSPTLFNIYTSDIPKPEHCDFALYADDTAIYCHGRNLDTLTSRLNNALSTLSDYYSKWKIQINSAKTQAAYFPPKQFFRSPPTSHVITPNGSLVEWSTNIKYLGVILDKNLTFGPHIQYTRDKAQKAFISIYPLIARNSKLSQQNKNILFKSLIRPILTYSAPLWKDAAKSHLKKLQVIQNKTLKSINNLEWRFPTTDLHQLTKYPTITEYCESLTENFNHRNTLSTFELIRDL